MSSIKKINLVTQDICVNTQALSQAFSSNKAFGIVLDGNIKYTPFNNQDIFIYQREISSASCQKNSTQQTNQELLGIQYQLKEEGDNTFIQAKSAWQDIITYNLSHCAYDVTTNKEVSEFKHETIEDMSWMLIDFDITYKEMIEFLESNTEITLVYIENTDGSEFSGMAYFDNIKTTQKVFYTFCQNVIKDKLANDADFTYDYLDEDQREAVKYFHAK